MKANNCRCGAVPGGGMLLKKGKWFDWVECPECDNAVEIEKKNLHPEARYKNTAIEIWNNQNQKAGKE